MDKIVLFDKKENCCGCGACVNVCRKNAISMKEDECGFVYPHINYDLCVGCGMCKKVCAYQNIQETNSPIAEYVSASTNEKQILKSASGGIFSAIATYVLKNGGVVFGSAFEKENDCLVAKHILVSDSKDLEKLQGSKYVQSDIGLTYRQAKEQLDGGKLVLFSGTPCQIAGLKSFLNKEYDNLYTIDIICHGVPNSRFFNDYIKISMKKLKGSIIDYKFRDKEKGWGMTSKFIYSKNGKITSKGIPSRLSSYFTLFLDSHTYRTNCYSCKYACSNRPGDITIGDYWGIRKEHPELLNKYNEKLGISCIIANTTKGVDLVAKLDGYILKDKSEFSKIANKNGQLKSPSKKGGRYDEVFRLYRENGYDAVESYFYKSYKKQIIVHTIYNMIPRCIRIRLKELIKK